MLAYPMTDVGFCPLLAQNGSFKSQEVEQAITRARKSLNYTACLNKNGFSSLTSPEKPF
jgi:hypothetical protein